MKIQYRILGAIVLFSISSLSSVLAQTEYIANGGFESGATANWNMVNTIVLTSAPHSGTHNAYLGETANETDTMYQTITIPNNATVANLTYWYNITSSDTGATPNDILTVSIQNSSGTTLTNVDTKSNVNRDPNATTYHQRSAFDLLPYKGSPIRVHFKVVMNATVVTSFRIDDVSVLVTTATPPTVQTLAADLITTNSARLNSSVNPNGANTTIYFQYGLTASYGSTSISGNIGTVFQNYATAITNLLPNTVYHFRIVAYNNGGTNFGNDLTFTNLAMQLPPTAQTLAADLITANSARLNSSVNPNGGSTIIYFQYGLTASYGSTTISGNIGTAFQNYATSVTNLSPNTIYHFRIVAYNSGGTNVGNDLTFTNLALAGAGLSVLPLSLTFSSSPRSVVDLLVAYTPAAAAEADGNLNLIGEITTAVKQANEAYVNSQINQRLRLLCVESIDYAEAASIGTDINRLTDKTDGYLDSVHSARDNFGADIVALVEASGSDFGGIAKGMTNVSHSFESNALCIVRRPKMNSGFALAHETGHIMGCAHDRAQPGNGAYSYSYGYLLEATQTLCLIRPVILCIDLIIQIPMFSTRVFRREFLKDNPIQLIMP